MIKVIPQVGQVYSWDNWVDGVDTIASMSPNLVIWEGGSSTIIHDGILSDRYTFKPANDLEWLAVNTDEWCGTDEYPFIMKLGSQAEYTNANCDLNDRYTRQQWQDKRNELFGEKAVSKKMKVEYVEAKFNHAWEAVKEYQEEGDLFCDVAGSYEVIPNAMSAHRAFNGENIYRRVETEVTWQGELAELISKSECISNKHNIGMFSSFDSNSVECSDFIAMCHIVASMTDKPE